MSYRTTININQTLVVEECWVCGVHFGMTSTFQRKRSEDGKVFFCPAGCRISYGESKVQQLERALEAERTRRQWERDQREATERSLAAQKGQVTKLKKRIGAGVCPCCNRHFTNVERHMASQHPDYAEKADA